MRCSGVLLALAVLFASAGCLDLDAVACTRNSDCGLGLQCGVDGLCAKPPEVDAGADEDSGDPGAAPAEPDAGPEPEPDEPDGGVDPERPFDLPTVTSDLPLTLEPTP